MWTVEDATKNRYNCGEKTYTTVTMMQTTLHTTNITEYWYNGYNVNKIKYFSVKQQ